MENTSTPRAALLAEMRSAATAVYIELEKSVADDVSGLLTRAAAEIRALEGQLEAAEQHVKILNESVESLGIQLTALRQDRERLEIEGDVRACAWHHSDTRGAYLDVPDSWIGRRAFARLAARQAGRTEG